MENNRPQTQLPDPGQVLTALGKPYIIMIDLPAAIGITLDALWTRLRIPDLPADQRPENNGAFKAGRVITFQLDAAIAYCHKHRAFWTQRLANRNKGRTAATAKEASHV